METNQTTNEQRSYSSGEQTKKCKHCQSDIPAKAKVCPVCKKKQKPSGCLILVIAFVVLGIIGAALGGSDDPKKVATNSTTNDTANTTDKNSTDEETTEDTSNKEQVFGLGDSVEYNNVTITFTDIQEKPGSQYNKPGDGNVFLLLYFDIDNQSDKELTISSLMSFNTYIDGYSTQLSIQSMLEDTDNHQLDGTVAAGKKMKGFVGYEVPSDYSEIEVRVTPDFWVGKDIIFSHTK